jgi:hypothetical protein
MTFGDRTLRDLHWSPSEKKCARAAFDAALVRECTAIRKQVEDMLRASAEPDEIWRIDDLLSGKRKEVGQKYDFRYSMLIAVLGRLLHEGWVTEADLAGLKEDKLEFIKAIAGMHGARNA